MLLNHCSEQHLFEIVEHSNGLSTFLMPETFLFIRFLTSLWFLMKIVVFLLKKYVFDQVSFRIFTFCWFWTISRKMLLKHCSEQQFQQKCCYTIAVNSSPKKNVVLRKRLTTFCLKLLNTIMFLQHLFSKNLPLYTLFKLC